MPGLEEKLIWESYSDWARRGDEWSAAWGGVAMQWHRTLLPRLWPFLPAGTILEISPGLGRWTQWLEPLCDRLHLVDRSEGCLDACRRRFADRDHLAYHVNDGKSLDAIGDESIDFAFSFDALVHAEGEVIRSYVGGLARTLRRDGVAFLHHSNLGEHAPGDRRWARLPFGKWAQKWLGRDEGARQGRAPCVSASLVRQWIDEAGLCCVSQELVNWGSRRLLDCFTVLTPRESRWARPTRVVRNGKFMDEVADAGRLAACYVGPA